MPLLTGTVRLADSEPATTAVVELHNARGDIVDQSVVDDHGRFRFHVSPAAWSVVGWDPHGHRWRGDASVTGDVAVELVRDA